MWFSASSCRGCYNGLVQEYDQALFSPGGGSGANSSMVIAPWNGAGGVRITNVGNVGIGTASPAVLVEVDGSMSILARKGGSIMSKKVMFKRCRGMELFQVEATQSALNTAAISNPMSEVMSW